MRPDKESTELFQLAISLEAMLSSDAWRYVEERIKQKILDLQNINNIDSASQDTIVMQLLARKMASEMLWEVLKKDVYGFIEQQKAAQERLTNPENETFIARDNT